MAERKKNAVGEKVAAERAGRGAPDTTVQKGYDAAREPEPQGDGDPNPRQVTDTEPA
jgi:hypothetical protein